MHACEPDLLDGLPGRQFVFVPQHRVEGMALIVDGQGVAGVVHQRMQRLVVDGDPLQQVQALAQFVDRHAHRVDRVPGADEFDRTSRMTYFCARKRVELGRFDAWLGRVGYDVLRWIRRTATVGSRWRMARAKHLT